jgi:hypothetical protein
LTGYTITTLNQYNKRPVLYFRNQASTGCELKTNKIIEISLPVNHGWSRTVGPIRSSFVQPFVDQN